MIDSMYFAKKFEQVCEGLGLMNTEMYTHRSNKSLLTQHNRAGTSVLVFSYLLNHTED